MKGITRRSLVVGTAAVVAGPVLAQEALERPLTIVVPAPAGGTADIAARALQEPLSKALGQSVVVENKGGANG